MQALHSRLQPFLLFFIDGASFIDAEDTKWELLVATEQHAGQEIVVSPQAHSHSAKLIVCMTSATPQEVSSIAYTHE